MDEFSLLNLVHKNFKIKNKDVVSSIGDDTAVIDVGAKKLLFTVDSLVENIHFRRDWGAPIDWGIKAMAMNISDIAAMGGKPLYALIAWNKGNLTDIEIEGVVKGIKKISEKFSVDLVGGNISDSKEFSLNITLVGECDKPIYRAGAETGDLIVVTGDIGDAALGLKLLLDNNEIQINDFDDIIKKQLRPVPRINEAIVISEYAHSMMDISDGVLLDLNRLLAESEKGAIIYTDKLPRSKSFLEFLRNRKVNSDDSIFWGGEDYELLFTVSEEGYEKLLEKYNYGTKLTIIGVIKEKKGLFVDEKDRLTEVVSPVGWIH